jgi:hypothetical protein
MSQGVDQAKVGRLTLVEVSPGRALRVPKLDRFTKYSPTGSCAPTGRPMVWPGWAADAA